MSTMLRLSIKLYYQEQVLQIHVMAEYAQRGLRAVADAVRLAADYFILSRGDLITWTDRRPPGQIHSAARR
jgi:ATP-dependent DNA helicase RecQ